MPNTTRWRELAARRARQLADALAPPERSDEGADAGPPTAAEERDRRSPRLVFVLGSQRSGTNALRRSISLDPWVMGFNERESDRWYDDWRLRPEPEIRDDLLSLPTRHVLFKPIVNLLSQPVGQWLEQWNDYDARVAWIYRDPVDVFQSRSVHWENKGDVDDFIEEWHRVNSPVVNAMDEDGRISLVRYDDLVTNTSVVWALFRRLGVRGENLFRASTSKGRQRFADSLVSEILERTADLRGELDGRRTFLPTPSGSPPGTEQ